MCCLGGLEMGFVSCQWYLVRTGMEISLAACSWGHSAPAKPGRGNHCYLLASCACPLPLLLSEGSISWGAQQFHCESVVSGLCLWLGFVVYLVLETAPCFGLQSS